MWNDFFYYRRGERIAVVILLVLILAGAGVIHLCDTNPPQDIAKGIADTTFLRACDSFYLSLRKDTFPVRYKRKQAPEPRLQSFDPNLADSSLFTSLGLPPWVARNILRYRQKGGRFYRPEQFARIYGIDSLQFQTLLPYIRIDTVRLKKNDLRYERDSSRLAAYPQKFTEITVVELNGADTALLRKVPGIGAGFAGMMVRYRAQLGGFYRVEQLREIPGVTDSLFRQWEPWFEVDPSLVVPIPVNKAGITRLRNHPYLNFYQAKVMTELRREYKRLSGIGELSLLEEFSAADLDRLKPYLSFE